MAQPSDTLGAVGIGVGELGEEAGQKLGPEQPAFGKMTTAVAASIPS